jgi:oxygen-independent coproporphyrinogen-3 oxidase
MPDRIAFYSYAHVPWVKPGQRSYTDKDLPDNAEKRALYETGFEKLKSLGYQDIGMDHFALPQDPLFLAQQNKTLHRNFMGYTTCQTDLLLGLGTSSISDAKYGYLQNQKKVEDYKASIATQNPAILKGHLLQPEDLIIKNAILSIACQGELNLSPDLQALMGADAWVALNQMEMEGLITLTDQHLRVTGSGQPFIRNICMVFDLKLRNKAGAGEQVFSKSI